MGLYRDKKVGDPKWIAGDDEHDAALAEYGVSVDALSRTSARPIRWLVENVIPHEAVTLIAGESGAGKTLFACQLAADATRVSRMRVVLAVSGDESAELLRWRLEQAEGDARRVALVTLRPNGFYDKRGNPTAEELDERMAILSETRQAAGDPKSGILPEQINVPEELYQQGIDNGHTKGTLVRAAIDLGIHPQKTGFNGGWEMRWVPQPVVQGRGTTAMLAGAGFKIFGPDDEQGRGEKWKKGRQDDGASASCASSQKHEEFEVANCASPAEIEESGRKDVLPHLSPLPEGDETSCAPSQKHEEFEAASCASSANRKESCLASCAPSNGEQVPGNHHATRRVPGDGCSAVGGPPDKLQTWYEVIVDGLREAC